MPRPINLGELSDLRPKELNFVIEYSIDFSARNAAERSGYSAEYGYQLMQQNHIKQAIDKVLAHRMETSHYTAEYVLQCAAEHRELAVQQGNLGAANTALTIMAKHTFINAFAAEKVEVTSDQAVMERLLRGRRRLHQTDEDGNIDEISFF